ncbi:MAG TPA: acylphosphatase [Candidatus Diapherotrites archaeon]|uniref:acylphosphatase n=1 Tax=Candidatus Iainarchaeum sp. TaxID=3101447 RepID=A0A7J4JIL2_9ARCH|nr:acylphosphatase [Candidatus Diapherotrites archaeon]HIH16750.1 acylphosphatase [Candidatus Diapherotrites archaeon]
MTLPIRVRLVVEGNVQGVGYRAYVKQVARGLRIKGCSKNLDDGTVEAYCEAPSREALDAFKRKLYVKGDAENPFSAHVAAITVFTERDQAFKPKANVFKTFWIDFGAKLSLAEREMIEKTEIAGLMLLGVGSDVKGLSADVKGVGMDVKGLSADVKGVGMDVKGVGAGVKGVDKTLSESKQVLTEFKDESKASFKKLEKTMHGVDHTLTEFKNQANQKLDDVNQTMTGFKDQTVGNFSSLDVKYGTVSGSLDKINAQLEALNGILKRIAAKILSA